MAKMREVDDSAGGASSPPNTNAATTTEPAAQVAVAAPPKLRRRPLLALAGLALVILGAVAAVWVYLSGSEAVEVIAARETVMRGETIEVGDLMVLRVSPDPALRVVPGAELDSFVGQRAARDITAGGLLTREVVTDQVVPGEGFSVVGLALGPALMPGEPLQTGDTVRVVATPGQAGDPATFEAAGTQFPGEVAGVSVSATSGESVVSVLVEQGHAAEIVQWSSAGRVALVLDSREGD